MAADLTTATARYWSRFSGGRYAEPFETIRSSVTIAAPSVSQLAPGQEIWPDG